MIEPVAARSHYPRALTVTLARILLGAVAIVRAEASVVATGVCLLAALALLAEARERRQLLPSPWRRRSLAATEHRYASS